MARRAAEQRLIAQTILALVGRCPHQIVKDIEMAQCELEAGHYRAHVAYFCSSAGIDKPITWDTNSHKNPSNRSYARP